MDDLMHSIVMMILLLICDSVSARLILKHSCCPDACPRMSRCSAVVPGTTEGCCPCGLCDGSATTRAVDIYPPAIAAL